MKHRAVKLLRPNASDQDQEDFLREASIQALSPEPLSWDGFARVVMQWLLVGDHDVTHLARQPRAAGGRVRESHALASRARVHALR